MKAHNEGRSPHTSKYKPWKLVAYVGFCSADKAAEFEMYLKSGSGRAFANKRLWESGEGTAPGTSRPQSPLLTETKHSPAKHI
jgi:predicted GIY-YIG superfamily endonuclease